MPKKLLNSPVFLLASIVSFIALAAALSPKTRSLVEAAADSRSPRAMALSQQWTVASVADGDTITVRRGGETKKIRFCGIDAPEKAQPLGKESKANLQRLVNEVGGRVMITPIESDRYGRTVAEIFSSKNGVEKSLNEEQLSSGNAYIYTQYVGKCPNKIAFGNAEVIAQSKKLGVWSGNYQRPWDYRKQQRNR
ncbi:thermonuclease family protein [Nostoc sp. UIC 10630]|uniref:thermonuclease family protein n=1 Tax=Nostoc sp. UIC 10630 TaxID=2100146 RepID=UPI001FB07944|nr:thermonuclease family protein [Nostoc sp. UIC 10630]